MSDRTAAARWVLVAYGVTALVFAALLLVLLGRTAIWINWTGYDATGDKLLGAAALAFAVVSLLAARDPLAHRNVVQMNLVFTAAGIVVLLYRLLAQRAATPTVAWGFLVVLAVFCALFAVTYPRAPATE